MDQKTQEWIAAAKARGAIQIDDSQPGQGFEDDETEIPLTPELAKQVEEIEDRIANRKVASSADELASAYKEENVNAVRKQRLPFQADLSDWHPGRILWMGEFLAKLQLIRPDAFLAEVSHLGLRGLGFAIGGVATYSGVSIQNGNAPEWSEFRFDAHGIPTSEKKRGWRAVLLALIRNDFITVEDSDRIFGKAEMSIRSRSWWRALYSIRNNKCPECQKQLCVCGDGYESLRADNYAYGVPSQIVKGQRQTIENPADSRIWTP
ncbi:MAG: hypothetical protein JWQ87_5447 [Candidatus Sulfotelmatobacter sp.]|nr:hypothetical protein [Candidatus Sulfotelmatobacter sp.]